MPHYQLRYKGEKVLLARGQLTLGRSVDCGLHLDDEKASRCHAILHVGEDSLELEDLDSRNGVFVNGERVEGRRVLRHGDAISVGAQVLEIVEEGERLRRSQMSTVGDERSSGELEVAIRGLPGVPSLTPDLKQLSPRELEVLTLVARGHTHKEVAEELKVSIKTVETYRARVATKLGLRSRAELVKLAIDAGLLANERG